MPAAADAVLTGRARWAVVHGDCRDLLRSMPDRSVDHFIQDPPYSPHVHSKQRRQTSQHQRTQGRQKLREGDLRFDPLDEGVREYVAREMGRLCRRWAITFTDAESLHEWRRELVTSALEHIRVGAWVKSNPQPQFSGDRPAAGFEAISICHARGRKRWNRGGHPAIWTASVTTEKSPTGQRYHPAQKPLGLMMELVEAFTDPGDLVVDAFCGAATTGVACLRLGRRFLGVEKCGAWAATARARMSAEMAGVDLRAAMEGQMGLFGGAA